MNDSARSVRFLPLLALLHLSCLGMENPPPRIDGTTFRASYADMLGDIEASFRVSAWDVAQGEDLDLAYDIRIRFNDGEKRFLADQVNGLWIAFAGERVFDADGRYHQMFNALMSTQLTTTGIPIENAQPMIPSKKMGHGYTTPFDFVQYVPFDGEQGADGVRLAGAWKKRLDGSVPPGFYRLWYDFFFDTRPQGPKPWSIMPFLNKNDPRFFSLIRGNPNMFEKYARTFYPKRVLPMIRVGQPATPKIPWILFPEIAVNGRTGLVADEDRQGFELSFRRRYPSRLILEPGPRRFCPCFITVFPLAANLEDIPGSLMAQREVPLFLDFGEGQVSARVEAPDGTTHDLGSKAFRPGKKGGFPALRRNGGPELEGGDFAFDFRQWGKYTIRLEGWVRDVLGRTVRGGGSYPLWIGRELTYSSSVKPGNNFFAGDRFPSKVEINPPCPAEVEVVVDYYPRSDPSRRETHTVRGTANNYGYFFPPEGSPTLVFQEPGEYRSEFRASFRAPDGSMWFGDQTSVGVIVGESSRFALHGMRSSDSGELYPSLPNFGMQARYALHDKSTTGLNAFDMSDCYDIMIPYHSGDVLYVSANYTGFENVTSYFSIEPRDPAIRGRLCRAFAPTPLLTTFRGLSDHREDKMLRINPLQDLTYIIRDDDQADQFPILFQNRRGLHPFSFPEVNDVEAYTYFSSLKPGLTTYVATADSTLLNSYWTVSPNSFGNQLNAGVNGDMPNDIYRITGGFVYKDRANGIVDYDAYAATIVVTPKDTNNNRVTGPCEEPLFTINGKEQWLGIAMATNEVLEVGDRISMGSLLFPAVPADVRASLTWPDGRTEVVEGKANRLGAFGKGVFTVDRPGVYRATETASYKGRSGDVFGSGDGVFNHYVVERSKPDILRIDLPPIADYDVTRILEIPVRILPGYTDPKVTYSVFFPGIIADEGEFFPENGRHVFRFIPSQFAMQFPSFDITDFRTGRPTLNDSVFFVFFVEATGPDGKPAFDVAKVMIRGRKVYYLRSLQQPGSPSPPGAAEPLHARGGISAPPPPPPSSRVGK